MVTLAGTHLNDDSHFSEVVTCKEHPQFSHCTQPISFLKICHLYFSSELSSPSSIFSFTHLVVIVKLCHYWIEIGKFSIITPVFPSPSVMVHKVGSRLSNPVFWPHSRNLAPVFLNKPVHLYLTCWRGAELNLSRLLWSSRPALDEIKVTICPMSWF